MRSNQDRHWSCLGSGLPPYFQLFWKLHALRFYWTLEVESTYVFLELPPPPPPLHGEIRRDCDPRESYPCVADNKEYEIFREIDNGRGDLLLFVTRHEIGRLPFGSEKDCTQFSFKISENCTHDISVYFSLRGIFKKFQFHPRIINLDRMNIYSTFYRRKRIRFLDQS